MKIFRRHMVFYSVLSALMLAAGCQVPPTETANTATTATPQPTASPTTSAGAAERNAPNSAITLPVLDYLFQSDDSFIASAKQQLALTDEQITRLREAARNDTAKLKEGEGEEYTGTTRAARQGAQEQLRSILGEEKAREFAAFVTARMNSGGEASDSNTTTNISDRPNAVPTDTRIVVNAPAFRMDVFENGRLVKSYKVGIGYPEFPLPVGLRKAETIIFNPTWTPPDEPWVEASGKVKVGEKVAAGSSLNPLGPIKIPIGMPSLIHGGKQPARLGNFASHGCVGLTNQGVQDVALVLARLSDAELTPEEIKGYEQKKTETKNYKLPRAIPVELRYETIVVENGKLHIYRDVYDRDTNTEENLRRTLQAYEVSFESLREQDRVRILNALKQMSRDAQGNLDAPGDGSSNANRTNANNNSNSNRVTRNIKGQKEIVIELIALQGKGYPAPVGMESTGGVAPAANSGTRKRG